MADRSILSAHSTQSAAATSDAVRVRLVGTTRVVDGHDPDARARTEQEFATPEACQAKWHEEDKERFHRNDCHGPTALSRT